MSLILWLFVLVGLYGAIKFTPGQAFVRVYIPVLLFFPDTFHAMTPGLPDPSANMATLMPIFLVTLIKYGRTWRPTIADLMVIAIGTTMTVSEYLAAGYSEAQNLLAVTLLQIVGPYLVARMCIANEQLNIELAKQFCWISFIVAIIGLFQFKFGWNPFLTLPEKLFPGQGGWVTTFRHGFARVAGPYAHCILAGMIMIMAYRLARWLEWNKFWEPKFAAMPDHPWSKARIITVGILIGSITTIARGPWLGGIIAAILVNAGRHAKRKTLFMVAAASLILIGIPGYIGFNAYMDVKPGMKMTMSQETAIYRKELFEKYIDIALDHAMLGWGRNTYPTIAGMESIDNYYLLLSLMHGVLTTGLLLALMLWLCITLFRAGMREPAESNSLAFTFIGIIIAMFVSLVTVYLGEAVMPAFFLIMGWAESYKQGNGMAGIFASLGRTNATTAQSAATPASTPSANPAGPHILGPETARSKTLQTRIIH